LAKPGRGVIIDEACPLPGLNVLQSTKQYERRMLVEIMKNIYSVPRAIIGDALLKNTHAPGGMFAGRYVGTDEQVIGVNAPTTVEIVLVETNWKKPPERSVIGPSLEGFGFIIRPGIGKVFPSDTDVRVVDFYRYLPLICARISIRTAGDSTLWTSRKEDTHDARITVYGNVLHVEHFLTAETFRFIADSLRTSNVCVLQVDTHAFAVGTEADKVATKYFHSDLIGDKMHETINGKIGYFFDEQIGKIGYKLRDAEYFALRWKELL
jgi:hypothetical protein